MQSEISKSVARNFSIMFGAQIVTWISGFVLLMFLPRYLGSEDYGRLYLALSVKMMLGLIIDFGGNYLITKEIARSEKIGSKILSSYFMLRILLWALAIIGIILASEIFGYSEHVHLLILVLAVGKLFEGGSTALKAYFQGIERTEYPAMGQIAERVFVAVFSVIALLMGSDSLGMAVIIVLGTLLNLIIILWFSRNFVTLTYQFETKIFSLLKSGLPYFLFSLFSIIYYRVDAVMLSSMTTEAVTGWYGGAYRFFDMVMILPIIYTTVIFPIFSKLWDDKNGVLENTFGTSLKLILILGMPAAIMIFLFSDSIIQFFMGLEEYGPSVIVLQVFAITIPIIYVDFILSSAIMGAANRQHAWAVVGFIAIFINIAINYFLIPYSQTMYGNGGIGAAVATFFTELFVMLSALYLLPNSYFKSFKPAYIFKPIGAGIVLAAFIYAIAGIGLYWMVEALLGGVVYLGALFALKTFDPQEIELLKNYASKRGLKMIFSKKIKASP